MLYSSVKYILHHQPQVQRQPLRPLYQRFQKRIAVPVRRRIRPIPRDQLVNLPPAFLVQNLPQVPVGQLWQTVFAERLVCPVFPHPFAQFIHVAARADPQHPSQPVLEAQLRKLPIVLQHFIQTVQQKHDPPALLLRQCRLLPANLRQPQPEL
jgi:hypothetical protein